MRGGDVWCLWIYHCNVGMLMRECVSDGVIPARFVFSGPLRPELGWRGKDAWVYSVWGVGAGARSPVLLWGEVGGLCFCAFVLLYFCTLYFWRMCVGLGWVGLVEDGF